MTACFLTLFYNQVFSEKLFTLNYEILHERGKLKDWVIMQYNVMNFNVKLMLPNIHLNICINPNQDAWLNSTTCILESFQGQEYNLFQFSV